MCYNKNMNFAFKTLTCFSYLFSTVSFAAQNPVVIPAKFDAGFVATKSAQFLNEMGNWENLLRFLETTEGKNQAKSIREVLKNKVDMHTAFPKFSVRDNKLIFANGKTLVINRDRSFNYQGMVFHEPDQALDRYLQDALERLTTVSCFSLFSECAQAAFNSQEWTTSGVLAALTVVGIASLAVVSTGPVLAAAGIATAVVGIGGLAVLIGNHIYQRFRSGEVECRGSEFYVRYQPKDSLTSESAPVVHEDRVYPKDENGKPLPCTPERAKTLQNIFTYSPYVDRLESQPSNPGASR